MCVRQRERLYEIDCVCVCIKEREEERERIVPSQIVCSIPVGGFVFSN